MRLVFLVLAIVVGSVALGQGDYKQNINFKRQMRADTATLQLVMLPNLSLPTATAYPLLRDTATGKLYKDTCGYWRKCDTFPYLPLAGGTMDSGAHIYFGIGGQNISQGTFDNGTSGNRGISLNCAIGYELNWQGGHLSSSYNNGANYIPVLIDSGLHVNGDGVNPTAVFEANGVEAMRIDTNGNTFVKNGFSINADSSSGITIYTVKVHLDSTQLRALNSVPFEVLPAPGAGYFYRVPSASMYFHWNSQGFDNGYGIALTCIDVGDFIRQTGSINLNTLSSNFFWEMEDSWSHQYSENAALILLGYMDSVGGNSSIDCYITVEKVKL